MTQQSKVELTHIKPVNYRDQGSEPPVSLPLDTLSNQNLILYRLNGFSKILKMYLLK